MVVFNSVGTLWGCCTCIVRPVLLRLLLYVSSWVVWFGNCGAYWCLMLLLVVNCALVIADWRWFVLLCFG